MKQCGIYRIGNLTNGKIYVGQSVDMGCRKRHHFADLRLGRHSKEHLQRAFLQDGEQNFEFRVLEEAPEAMLDILERAWIRFYRSTNAEFGYNSTDGGWKNKHLSEEHRKKIGIASRSLSNLAHLKKLSEANRGTHISKEHRQRISGANKGKVYSLATRLKMAEAQKQSERSIAARAARKGIPHSMETRQKISAALTGRPSTFKGHHHTEETRRRLSEAHKGLALGRHHSEESKRKMSIAKKGKRRSVAICLRIAEGIRRHGKSEKQMAWSKMLGKSWAGKPATGKRLAHLRDLQALHAKKRLDISAICDPSSRL